MGYIYGVTCNELENDFLGKHLLRITYAKMLKLQNSIYIEIPEYLSDLKSATLLHTEFNSYVRYIAVVGTVYFGIMSVMLLKFMRATLYNVAVGASSGLRGVGLTVSKRFLFINRLIVVRAVNTLMHTSYNVVYRYFDKGLIEGVGPFGIVESVKNLLHSQNSLQSGLVYHYAGFLLITMILIIHFVLDTL